MTTRQVVVIEGKSVPISNLDKVLWPEVGLTKTHLLEYYARLYPYLQRHWQGRALTVTRYPHGVDGEFFYQKNVPPGAPAWVQVRTIKDVNYVVAQDLATIIWLANSGAIEFHPSTYLAARPDTPTHAIIDLDPTPPAGFADAVEVAKYVRELLDKLALKGYPKLSGATGVHIYLPLEGSCDFQLSSQLAYQIGLALQTAHPEKITLERLIKRRHGVYVDYLQNSPGKTMVGVYSPRPTAQATVSTPVDWSDLDYYQPEDFTIKTVPQWVEERGDLFSGVLEPQSLQHLFFPAHPV
ncbi:MAG TPA: DNA polymerase domain-containing protein [Firmicutes bacterium]|nr:DNA polymerase domain-containing protein [Bacillota bacterium]